MKLLAQVILTIALLFTICNNSFAAEFIIMADTGSTAENNWAYFPSGTSQTIRTVSFFNPDTGFAAGDGVILRTLDGGRNWTFIDSSFTAGKLAKILTESHQASGNNVRPTDNALLGSGLIVGSSILRTTSFGASWSTITNPTSSVLYGITNDEDNYSADIVYAVGDSGTIIKSTTGGLSWFTQTSPTANTLRTVTFWNADTGIAAGDGGVVLRTTNGGNTWTILPDSSFAAGTLLKTTVENHNSSRSNKSQRVLPGGGLLTGDLNPIYITKNYGESWDTIPTAASSSKGYIGGKGGDAIMAAGDNGTYLFSRDGGVNWTAQTSRTKKNINWVAIKEEGVKSTLTKILTDQLDILGAVLVGENGLVGVLQPPGFTIDSPGPIWYTGTQQTITWAHGDPSWNVSINLVDVNTWTTVSTIAGNTPNDGSEIWNIPPDISPGTYQVFIQEVNKTTWAYSDTFTIAASCNSSTWSALGTGMNGQVLDLFSIGTDLYAGGKFTTAGGGNVNYIAKWDGNSWSALGSGMDAFVTTLAVLGGELYAGGDFITAGGTPANHIAKWNGTSWSALGSGTDATVYSLAVLGGELYAGGDFTTAGSVTVNHIAKWNGSSWSALGTGMNGQVPALTVLGGELYAGGTFTTAGSGNANRIAKWNGTSWSALGSGMNLTVIALAVNGTDIYAGGNFTTAGGMPANSIAKWDGSNWSALSSGMSGQLEDIAVLGSDIYAVGQFFTAGGVPANYIAKWNGSNWSALGNGTNAVTNALEVIGDDLYAGGNFTTAGDVSANQIAKWSCQNLTDVYERVPLPVKFDLMQNYPNPFNPSTIIQYDIPRTSFVKISVYDILGREIRVLVNEQKVPGQYNLVFDAKNLASGIYFYAIRTADFNHVKKMVLLR